MIDASREIGADIIELHTGEFANAASEEQLAEELEKIVLAAKHAKKIGLGVNAGHGLNYQNIKLVRDIYEIDEVSIGHSVIARAVMTGLPAAVQEMIRLIRG